MKLTTRIDVPEIPQRPKAPPDQNKPALYHDPEYWVRFFEGAQTYKGHIWIEREGYFWTRRSYNIGVSNSYENMIRAIDVLEERGFLT